MAHKCDNCFYRTDWGGKSPTYSICERVWYESFEIAKAECEKPGECEFKVSEDEEEIAE